MSGYDDRYEDRSSLRKHGSRGSEQEMSRMRDRERDHERHHRDNRRDRSMKDERGRNRHEDNDRRYSRDNDRHRNNDHDRDRRQRHRSRSKDRSRDRSQSPSKSKRASGFDMAPPGAPVLPGAAISGQLPDITQPVTSLFPNMAPLAAQQFGSLPMMPAQAMTQQATRHARRVYVGGLPPMANEQVAYLTFKFMYMDDETLD